MKKVCIIFPFSMGANFLSGGVGKLVIENIKAINSDYDVYLLLPDDNLAFKQYLDKNYISVKVIFCNFHAPAQFADTRNWLTRIMLIINQNFKFIKTVKNVKNYLEQIKPDIAHFHAEVSFPYLMYAKKLGIKTIFHTSSYRFAGNKLLRNLVANYASSYADLIISPTVSIDDLFYKNKNRIIITNPISILERSDDSIKVIEDMICDFPGIKFLFTGRISRVKQIHYFIEALNLLDESIKNNLKFFIIGKANNEGDLEYYHELQVLIENYNLEDKVIFLGYKNNVDDYLAYMDVGVLLSKSEAISMSGIEYLFNRMPIIAFNNPGLNELVLNKENGLLVDDGDVKGLSNAISFMVNNPSELHLLQERSYQHAQQNYSVEKFKSSILKGYRQLGDGLWKQQSI